MNGRNIICYKVARHLTSIPKFKEIMPINCFDFNTLGLTVKLNKTSSCVSFLLFFKYLFHLKKGLYQNQLN